jgi:hypothetical protein
MHIRYLLKTKPPSTRVRTEEPDYSDLLDNTYDWTYTVYGKVNKLVPEDAPRPLGSYVTLSYYVDANLTRDVVMGRSFTGILHCMSKTL